MNDTTWGEAIVIVLIFVLCGLIIMNSGWRK